MPVGDASPPAADDPLIGSVVSERYRIIRKVGEGGMGAVYQAEHALIEKRVALKILFQDLTRRPDLVARFLQEAKSASRIGQENVIDISDFGQSADGLVYIAMEFLDGQDLGKTLRTEKQLPWTRTRPILMQITKALRAAHSHGIIHRDMKPENVYLVQREGRADFVKVLDFGIAKVVSADDNDGPRLTQTGMIFGTPEYMSPEQAQGHPPDHRLDVYAVGCIMYHMLTGAVPFTADSFMGILTKHLLEPVVPLRKRRPDLDIPADVEAVCLRAMEKDRDKRWPDMDAFYQALGAAGGVPFEPSNVFVAPQASLKYPQLTEANAGARQSKTAISGVATFPNVRRRAAPARRGARRQLERRGQARARRGGGRRAWSSPWRWRCAADTRPRRTSSRATAAVGCCGGDARSRRSHCRESGGGHPGAAPSATDRGARCAHGTDGGARRDGGEGRAPAPPSRGGRDQGRSDSTARLTCPVRRHRPS